MTNQQGVEWRDYLDAKFETVEQMGQQLGGQLGRLEDRFGTVERTVATVQETVETLDRQMVSHRMRLENVEARIPLLTQQEGRLLAKVVGMVTAVAGTLWSAWWAITHWVVAISVGLGLAARK